MNVKITLKAARVNAGLTQRQAAKRLNISPQTLVNWEKKPEIIPISRMKEIESAYGIPITSIFFDQQLENLSRNK